MPNGRLCWIGSLFLLSLSLNFNTVFEKGRPIVESHIVMEVVPVVQRKGDYFCLFYPHSHSLRFFLHSLSHSICLLMTLCYKDHEQVIKQKAAYNPASVMSRTGCVKSFNWSPIRQRLHLQNYLPRAPTHQFYSLSSWHCRNKKLKNLSFVLSFLA